MPRATIKPPNQPRCPDCGAWLSTRYSASRPHVCSATTLTGKLEPVRDEAHRNAISPSGGRAFNAATAARDPVNPRTRRQPSAARLAEVRLRPAQNNPDGYPDEQPMGAKLPNAVGLTPTGATHALKRWPPYEGAPVPQSAPAGFIGAWRPWLAVWAGGAASGIFVAVLVMRLLFPA